MSNKSANPAQLFSKRDVRVAWSIHALTASGVILGAFGLEAVVHNYPRSAIVWLIVAMIVDGIDGPIARHFNVRAVIPNIDGNILDLVVDYLTCVAVPVAFMARFDMFPPGWIVPLSFAILFTSVIWFARTDLMTDDHWFRGFPAIWNLVAPTLFLLDSSYQVNIIVTIALCCLTLSSVKFVHPVQVRANRNVNITVTAIWLAAMLWCTLAWPSMPPVGDAVLILAPAWFAYITVRRTLRGSSAEVPSQPRLPNL